MTIIDLSSYLFIKNQTTNSSIKRSASLRSIKKSQQQSKLYQLHNNQSIVLHKIKKGSCTYTFDNISHNLEGITSWIGGNIQNKLNCLVLTNNVIEAHLQELLIILSRNFLISHRQVTLLINKIDEQKIYSNKIRYLSEIKDNMSKFKNHLNYEISLVVDSKYSIFIRQIREYQGANHNLKKLVDTHNITAIMLLTLIKQPFSSILENTIKTLDIAVMKFRQLKLLNPTAKQNFSTNSYRQTQNVQKKFETKETKQFIKYNSLLARPSKNAAKFYQIQSSNDSLDASQKTERNETYKSRPSYQELKSQNIYLHHKISQMQKEFAKQSDEYVKKIKQKIKMLKQQNHRLTFENRKIKIDYEVIEGSLNQVKRQYEQTLLNRKQYEQQAQKIRKQYNDHELKQLRAQIGILLSKIDTMQEQFARQKDILEKRNQLQIQQLSAKYFTLKEKYISEIDLLEQTNKDLTNQLQLTSNRCKLLQITNIPSKKNRKPINK